MIQNAESNGLDGNAPIQDFKIEMNSVVFDMLVSKVYTDKIMAVIREWSTNAIDACIDANLPIKFDAHLPTILEPHFSVRDYGTGLSDADVLGIYSTLGASTKRNSNSFNGTFGIGRGAGLAYSTRFQVDSYFNGTKISYMISTDNGIPAMISLGHTPTDEHNGLLLQINVNSKDIQEFNKKAGQVYHYFDDKPNTNLTLDYPDNTIVLDGTDWYFEDTGYGQRYHNMPLAIMGNVAYQIDRAHFTDSDLYDILSSSIRFKVPLGEISITPGRESLSMDEKTIAYLKARFKRSLKDAAESLLKTLNKHDTVWEQMIGFNKAVGTLPYSMRKSVKWEPKGIKNVETSRWGYNSLQVSAKGISTLNEIAFVEYDGRRVNGRNMLNDTSDTVEINKNIKFMIADEGKGFANAAKVYQEANSGSKIILIKMVRYSKDGVISFIKEAKKIIKDFGDPTYVMSSDHSTITTATISSAGTRTITATNFAPLTPHLAYYSSNKIEWRKGGMLSSKTAKKFFYVEMSSHKMVTLSQADMYIYFNFFRLHKKIHKGDAYELVGVPKGAMKNIEHDARFIPIIKAAEELAPELSIVDFDAYDSLSSIFNSMNDRMFIELVLKLKNKGVSKSIETIRKFNKDNDKYDRSVSTTGMAKLLKVKSVSPALDEDFDTTMKRYPLMNDLQSGMWRDEELVNKVVRYVELEDCYAEKQNDANP